MSDQAPTRPRLDGPVAPPGFAARATALLLRADAAARLGPRPVALFLAHRAALAMGVPQRRLRAAEGPSPTGPFLPPAAPAAPSLPPGHAEALRAAAARLPSRADWHGPFDGAAHCLALDLFAPGDVRPVWERSRFAEPLLLAQAARIDPAGGHLARAERWIADWVAANPAFRGPAWACGQEAALRALSLCLTLALLHADRDPPPGARGLLRLCAARIAATPAYAAAQDNNHAISEPAGAFACALLLGEAGTARRQARRLAAAVARLVAEDGGFAQVSAGYARLALDVLAIVEWLRRRHGAPGFPAPLTARAAALAAWLHRVTAVEDGSTPALGVEDGSTLADLGLHGPGDARGSVERAARLFCGSGADLPAEAGAAWLGLPCPAARLDRPPRWRSAGTMGWSQAGATALLRTGPLRFRPAHSDLLHVTLRDGGRTVLRDGGTGAYNPPATWWWAALAGGAGHNGIVFDDSEPMPRAGRFLLGRWPRMAALPDGAVRRDADGNRHARRIACEGRRWTISDEVSGPFRRALLRWRLPAGPWRLTADGATLDGTRLVIEADAPLSLRLETGWESPAYGKLRPVPLLQAESPAPLSRIRTHILLPQ